MRYKINIEFDSPVSFTHTPIFDGILYGSYCRWVLMSKEGRTYYLKTLKTASKEHLEWIQNEPIYSVFPQLTKGIPEHMILSFDGLPIIQKSGVLQSSILQYQKGVLSTIKFRKRYRQGLSSKAGFNGRKKKVRINNGEFKSYDLPFGLEDIKYGYFVFETDGLDFVKFLMQSVRGINKKRNRGVGKIKSYSFEPTSEKIIRPIPVKEVPTDFRGEIKIVRTAWKPPYFHIPNQSFCQIQNI